MEVSPIASLDALTRFQEIVSSLSPDCRILNVLSLDGVSTVLISCEGIDRGTLARGLRDKIRGVRVATVEGRFVVELPDEW